MRQVAHALLTRPPLGLASLGFRLAPFDLHVLGTPPAFILSQDQTLMFCSLLPVCFSGSGNLFPVLFPFFWARLPLPDSAASFPLKSFRCSQRLPALPSSLGIFRAALLFICQGALRCPSAATPLSYHSSSALSTAFFFFYLFRPRCHGCLP